jgi:tetratricopeptide (TPR) repeat protein
MQGMGAALTEIERGIERFPDDKEMLALAAGYCNRLQKYEAAIDYNRRVLNVDPLYKTAYNNLAYIYNTLGEYESAIEAINTYICLAPDEANPYDTRGEIYANNGRIDLAIASYRQALEIKPDFRESRTMLGDIYLLQGNHDEAGRLFHSIAEDKDYETRVMGRMYLAKSPTFQGKFQEALQILEAGIARDLEENPNSTRHVDTGFKHFAMAWLYLELGEYEAAIREFHTHMEIYREAYPGLGNHDRHEYIQLLAEAGRIQLAEQTLVEYADDLGRMEYPESYLEYARGCIAFAKQDYPAAVDHLTAAVRAFNNFPTRFLLARAYQEAGRLSDAVSEFEGLLNRYSILRVAWAIRSVKMHYYLGLAYERSRWYDKAADQYAIFLNLWKDADHPVAERADAAERLQRLREQSGGLLP